MANTLKNYEKKYAALEEIVRTLDAIELSVNDLLTQYKKGLTLVKECSDMLQSVEGEVRQILSLIHI